MNHCDSLDCFFKRFKNKNCLNNIPLENLTLDFKFNFYKNLSNVKLDCNTNISNQELKDIFRFKKEKPFRVTECDKNIGVAFISHDLYDSLSLNQLNDQTVYSLLTENPFLETCSNIKLILEDLVFTKNISQKLFKNLIVANPKIGSFRILPKLHKSKFSVRPIINCVNHPTSNICLLIDIILQPFVRSCPSFIQDSQHTIQKLNNKQFPLNCKIYSCDFESLYTKINLEHALSVISNFISTNFISDQLTTTGFYKLLKLIFDNNIFKFKDKFFKQISGIAMGSKCGPSIANIYVHCLEQNFLNIHKPLHYDRFIDDILIIVLEDFDINLLKNHFDYLNLNIFTSDIVNFLDLNISQNKVTGFINFSVYIKPTQTFSYLLNSSNHPSFIFENIPYSLFFRIRRICSFYHDYLFFSRLLITQLTQRNFDPFKLKKISRMVGDLDRNSILDYKEKNKDEFSKKNLFYLMPFNFNVLNLEKTFYDSFKAISKSSLLSDFKFKLIYSMQPNLGSIFIHDFKIPSLNNFSFKKCKDLKCEICPYSNSSYFINLNNFLLPILSNSSCKSENCIYLLNCKLCESYYVGQTKRLKRRIRDHLNTIYFNNSFGSNCKCVSNHFKQPRHNYSKHFQFFVFNVNIVELKFRLNIESQLIHLLRFLNINLINDFIPDFYKTNLQLKLFS